MTAFPGRRRSGAVFAPERRLVDPPRPRIPSPRRRIGSGEPKSTVTGHRRAVGPPAAYRDLQCPSPTVRPSSAVSTSPSNSAEAAAFAAARSFPGQKWVIMSLRAPACRAQRPASEEVIRLRTGRRVSPSRSVASMMNRSAVTAKFGQHWIRASVPGVRQGDLPGLHADASVRDGVRERHARQLKWPCPVSAGQRMRVEDRGQVHVRLQSREPVEHAGRAVQRQSWLSGGPVEPQAEQPVQVDAVIGVLVSDGNGVQGTIWPLRKQPRKRRVAEIQGQAIAVPVHRETAARASRLGNAPQLPSTVTCRIRPAWHAGRSVSPASLTSGVILPIDKFPRWMSMHQ